MMARRQSTASTDGGAGGDSVSGNIRVVVRVRPQNNQEQEGQHRVVIRVLDENVLVFDPKEEASPGFFHGKRRRGRDIMRRKNKDIRFAFDHVFDTDASNRDVYENTTQGILDGLLDGYNCSVFAYGATGAGKTFSMLGSKNSPGVVFHTMMELYQRIDALKAEKTCDVAVSYLEVYNEQIRDLLNPGSFLPLREDPKRGAIVIGLSLHKPHTAEELLHMLEFGNQNRTQHPTDANAESSRSHAVFQVFVRQQDRTAGISADVRVAKISLIDLAGSERATVTKNRGQRFREGANINRSLLALGNCINALADSKYKGHIPYRDSKLTRLLKDSLGGNCRTVMIAAVSPSAASFEDTHNTLKYANRAKNIKSNLKRNIVSVDIHVSRYAKIVQELRDEVGELKSKLKRYESQPPSRAATGDAQPTANRQMDGKMQNVRDALLSVFSERLSIQKEVLELEGSERDLAYKIHRKQRAMARIAAIAPDPTKAVSRLERSIASSAKRRAVILSRKQAVQERMNKNQERLTKAEGEMPPQPPQELLNVLRCQHLDVELRNSKRQLKCLRKLVRAQNRDEKHANKLVDVLLKSYKQQYYLLKGSGIATSDIHADFENIQNLAGGQAEVAWADESGAGNIVEQGGAENAENDAEGPSFPSLDIDHLVTFPSFQSPAHIGGSPSHPKPSTPKTPKSSLKTRYESTPKSTKQFLHGVENVQQKPAPATAPPVPAPVLAPAPRPTTAPPSSHRLTTVSSEQRPVTAAPSVSDCVVSAPVTLSRPHPPPHPPHTPHPRSVTSAPVLSMHQHVYPPPAHKTSDSAVMRSPCAVANHNNDNGDNNNSPRLDSTVTIPACESALIAGGLMASMSSLSSAGSVSMSPNADATFVVDGVKEFSPGIQTVVLSDHSPRGPISTGTVTKAAPSVALTSHRGVKTNSGTVTKHAPNLSHASVVAKRSINFDIENQPSPAGKLTFAQAVKSPISAVPRSLSQLPPVTVRSPLASRENLPPLNGPGVHYGFHKPLHTVTPESGKSSQRQSRRRSPRHHPGSHKQIKRLVSNSSSSSDIRGQLHRMGLPSLSDRSTINQQQHSQQQQQQQQPNYMQMTKAASNRQRTGLSRQASFDQFDRQHPRGRNPTPPSTGSSETTSNSTTKFSARNAVQRSRSQSAMSTTRRNIKSTFF